MNVIMVSILGSFTPPGPVKCTLSKNHPLHTIYFCSDDRVGVFHMSSWLAKAPAFILACGMHFMFLYLRFQGYSTDKKQIIDLMQQDLLEYNKEELSTCKLNVEQFRQRLQHNERQNEEWITRLQQFEKQIDEFIKHPVVFYISSSPDLREKKELLDPIEEHEGETSCPYVFNEEEENKCKIKSCPTQRTTVTNRTIESVKNFWGESPVLRTRTGRGVQGHSSLGSTKILHLDSSALSLWNQNYYHKTHFFPCTQIDNFKSPNSMLRMGDVFAFTAATMQYDANWNEYTCNNSPFTLIHTAAPNTTNKYGQSYYLHKGHTQTTLSPLYLSTMRCMIRNVYLAAHKLYVQHMAINGIGLGAFMDTSVQVGELKKITQMWQEEWRNYGKMLHICVPSSTTDKIYQAFVPICDDSMIIMHPGTDAAAFAQYLANHFQSKGSNGYPVVAVLNPGNKCAVGNHWINLKTAQKAMDENFVRRSPSIAKWALGLNALRETTTQEQFDSLVLKLARIHVE